MTPKQIGTTNQFNWCYDMDLQARKPVLVVSDKARLKTAS